MFPLNFCNFSGVSEFSFNVEKAFLERIWFDRFSFTLSVCHLYFDLLFEDLVLFLVRFEASLVLDIDSVHHFGYEEHFQPHLYWKFFRL
jgi:hypothetical protein